MLHLNIRSISANFDNFRLFLDNPMNKSFSVIGLTETWLPKDNDTYSLPEYNLILNSRQDKIGGGVGLYIHNTLDHSNCEHLNVMNNIVESVFVEIAVPDSKNILIGVIYRPPNSDINEFLVYLEDLLRDPSFNNKDCYIMGDFNIDLLK